MLHRLPRYPRPRFPADVQAAGGEIRVAGACPAVRRQCLRAPIGRATGPVSLQLGPGCGGGPLCLRCGPGCGDDGPRACMGCILRELA